MGEAREQDAPARSESGPFPGGGGEELRPWPRSSWSACALWRPEPRVGCGRARDSGVLHTGPALEAPAPGSHLANTSPRIAAPTSLGTPTQLCPLPPRAPVPESLQGSCPGVGAPRPRCGRGSARLSAAVKTGGRRAAGGPSRVPGGPSRRAPLPCPEAPGAADSPPASEPDRAGSGEGRACNRSRRDEADF